MDLTLSQQDLGSVRQLLLAVPEPGSSLLPRSAVDALVRLLSCDAIGVAEVDHRGYRLRGFDLPTGAYDFPARLVCDGPLVPGVEHLATTGGPGPGATHRDVEAIDTIRLSRATPAGTIAQLHLDRRQGVFTPRDLALFLMVEPVISRLLATRPRLTGDDSLSGSELRVLELVAAGSSNRDVAERLCVSTATVRKHLEHCYRKLGVTNRTAAVALLAEDRTALSVPRQRSPFG